MRFWRWSTGEPVRGASGMIRLAGLRMTLPVLRRVLPLERLARGLARPRVVRRDRVLEDRLVRVAARLWRGSAAPCLERSLALYHVLGRIGAEPVLVAGMSGAGVAVTGHAWVEVAGAALLERDDPATAWTPLFRVAPDGVVMRPGA